MSKITVLLAHDQSVGLKRFAQKYGWKANGFLSLAIDRLFTGKPEDLSAGILTYNTRTATRSQTLDTSPEHERFFAVYANLFQATPDQVVHALVLWLAKQEADDMAEQFDRERQRSLEACQDYLRRKDTPPPD